MAGCKLSAGWNGSLFNCKDDPRFHLCFLEYPIAFLSLVSRIRIIMIRFSWSRIRIGNTDRDPNLEVMKLAKINIFEH
jgi:hypothetical protein